MLDDETLADPYALEDKVQSNRKDYEKYEECYSTKIFDDGRIEKQDTPTYKDLEDKSACTDNSQAAKEYSMYMFDLVTFKGAACYEGIEENACDEIGFNGELAAAAPSSTIPDDTGNGFKGTDTSGYACPAGSEDLDVVQVPTGEGLPSSIEQTSIRLCGVPEIGGGNGAINVAITQNFINLIAAAKADGLNLTAGNSFRTTESQINLRRDHCGRSSYAIYEMPAGQCSPPTARPGTSMHEWGLAIDFSNCDKQSTACFQWLATNAAEFGFKNLPSEPWHWSTTGG